MRILLVFTLIIISLIAPTVAAQDGCSIDLDASLELLEQAQTAANDDDIEKATALIADAQASLNAVVATCVIQGEQATYTLEDEGHSLTFAYPSSWVVNEMDNGTVSIASSQALMDRDVFGASDPKPLSEGETMVLIGLMTADSFASGAEELPTAIDLISTILNDSTDTFESTSEPEAFAASDFRAARANIVFNGVDATLVVIELDTRSTPPDEFYFGLMVVGGAPGSSETVAELAQAIGRSMRYDKGE